VLTGLDIETKAELAERTLWSLVPGGRDGYDAIDVMLRRTDRDDPRSNDEAMAELRVTVMDRDPDKVGRAFSGSVIEMALASYPGLFTTSPPTDASAFGVYWPTLVPDDLPAHEVVLGGERIAIPPLGPDDRPDPDDEEQYLYGLVSWNLGAGPAPSSPHTRPAGAIASLLELPDPPGDPLVASPLGAVFGTRSGDKGGNANVGVWARRDDAYVWLHRTLTAERLHELLAGEADELEIQRFELPNLRAVNFVIRGLLGRGVAASTRLDPQAKGLGEYLRAKVVELPARLLEPAVETAALPPPPVPA
jgi:hypothetical protein